MSTPNPNTQNMTHAIANQMGGFGPLNNYVHISEEAGFVYFGNPGACYARVLASMNMAIAATRGDVMVFQNIGQIYQRDYGNLANPWEAGHDIFDDMLDDPDTLKFTFVRDPIARFLTGYYGKLTKKTPRSDPRKKLFDDLELDVSSDISLEDLSGLLAQDSALRDLVPLMRLQRNMTAFDLVDYGFIGHHERWDQDFSALSSQVFNQSTPAFDPISKFNHDEDGEKVDLEISNQTRANLENAYGDDFAMLEEIDELFPLR